MLGIFQVPDMPQSITELYSFDRTGTKNYFFCSCGTFKNQCFHCSSCNIKSSGFFHVPDLHTRLEQIVLRLFPHNFDLKLTIYTDGISTFKSSNYSIWPIYIVFNCLELKNRYALENIAVCGVWYGNFKPDMQSLPRLCLEPYITPFNSFFNFKNTLYKLQLEFIVADKPARSMMLNMQSSNATYGCPSCLAICVTQNINDVGRRVYVPYERGQIFEPRTNEGFAAIAYSAQSFGRPEYGIKGSCFLQNFVGFKLVEANIFDYMHLVNLGIFKSMINVLFFMPSSPISFRNKVNEFDQEISKMKFPSSIVKSAPLLKSHKLWQAKDYRNFFYFCFPILFQNHRSPLISSLFSLRKGLILLSSDKITSEIASDSFDLFENFVLSVREILGVHYLTPNFHDLYHLPEMAKRSGPIHSFSGFNFEHINGLFARLCHGNKRFDLQIARKLESMIPRQSVLSNSSDSAYSMFIRDLLSPLKWKSTLKISELIFICGKRSLLNNHDSLRSLSFYDPNSTYFEANRAMVKGKKISTSKYCKGKKTNNSELVSESLLMKLTINKIIIKKDGLSYFCFALVDKQILIELDCGFFQIADAIENSFVRLEDLLDSYSFGFVHQNFCLSIPKLEYY